MKKNQRDVEEFMAAAGQAIPDFPFEPEFDTRKLRVMLLLEEVLELADASGVKLLLDTTEGSVLGSAEIVVNSSKDFHYVDTGVVDMVEVADAITDIEYVNQGAGSAYGLDLEPFWDEVQRSNMSKFIDGHEDPDTGKWIKGPSYSPAELSPILESQECAATIGRTERYCELLSGQPFENLKLEDDGKVTIKDNG